MKNKNTPPVILLNMAVDVIKNRENEVIISQYVQRVSDSGAVPMLIPSIEKEENIETLLDIADGVVLIGGRDYDPADFGELPHPEAGRDRLRPHFDIAFGKAVLKRRMPVLGICAGCQLLNIVSGGKLIQHLDNAVEWCKQRGIVFDAVNENLPEVKERWGGDTRKVYCDYYVDDKNLPAQFLDLK
jgi:gamma-glutamyl-gamma-aminobutyrate hydrolase PuuD